MAEIKFTNPETGESVIISDSGKIVTDQGENITTSRGNAKEALKWLFKNKKIKTDDEPDQERHNP